MKKQLITLTAAILIIIAGIYIHTAKKEKTMNNLSATDPELASLWNNFITKDVIPHGNTDAKSRYLALLVSHIAVQSPNEYKLMLNEALDNGVSPIEIKEAVYQSIPYAGMAKVYDFLLITNEVFENRGIKLPLEKQAETNPGNRLEKGLAVQKSIFGERIDQMRANAPEDLKHIQDYLSANCFGDYYTRRGLDIKTRELLTFAILASMGGAESQLKGHVQGNLNVGNDRKVLIETLTQLLPYIGYPRSLNAIAAINEIIPAE